MGIELKYDHTVICHWATYRDRRDCKCRAVTEYHTGLTKVEAGEIAGLYSKDSRMGKVEIRRDK